MGSVDDAEPQPDGHLDQLVQPRSELVSRPGVHADLAPPSSLVISHEHGPASLVEVAFCERERFLDAKRGATAR